MVDVSVICPTYHRHMFLPILIEQFKTQDYTSKMELIIFDDSEEPYPFEDIKNDSRIIYKHDNSKRFMLWEKRNILNDLCNGNIIVCMDDDDISFTNRITYSVEKLNKNPKALITGNSSLYIYDLLQKQLYIFPSRIKSYLLNGTFAYKKELLKTNKYKISKHNINEEKSFTKNYKTPYVLLDYDKTIICVSHNSNTVDKSKFCTIVSDQNIDIPSNMLKQFYNINPIIYWINLEKSITRKISMLEQLKAFKYHKRVEGVVDPEYSFNTKLSSKSEAACLNSHIKAMKQSLDDDMYDFAIICEDDIYFRDVLLFYERIFYYIRTAPKDWDILQLFNINLSLMNSNVKETDLLSWSKWKSTNYSTMIYIVKKKAIKTILYKFNKSNFKKQKSIADDFIYRCVKTYSIKLPFFLEYTDFDSEIHMDHVPIHVQYNQCIKTHHSKLNLKYPFFTI